ncbi:hypothetical protein D3C80_1425690 [compost metagenome]
MNRIWHQALVALLVAFPSFWGLNCGYGQYSLRAEPAPPGQVAGAMGEAWRGVGVNGWGVRVLALLLVETSYWGTYQREMTLE